MITFDTDGRSPELDKLCNRLQIHYIVNKNPRSDVASIFDVYEFRRKKTDQGSREEFEKEMLTLFSDENLKRPPTAAYWKKTLIDYPSNVCRELQSRFGK